MEPAPRPSPAGVLFDAGGTLLKVRTERLAVELRARGCEPVAIDEAFWRTLALLDLDFSPGSRGGGDWYARWLARWGQGCGVPGDVMVDAWHAADRDEHLWDEPLPGAEPCLRRLRAAGLRLGVVSNSDGRVGEVLARTGLAAYLDVVVDSAVVGVAKPDPAIFAHALTALELEPDEAWYVGDNVAYDAAAADAAGLTSWVVDHRGLHTVAHPRRVGSLEQFADAVLDAVGPPTR